MNDVCANVPAGAGGNDSGHGSRDTSGMAGSAWAGAAGDACVSGSGATGDAAVSGSGEIIDRAEGGCGGLCGDTICSAGDAFTGAANGAFCCLSVKTSGIGP